MKYVAILFHPKQPLLNINVTQLKKEGLLRYHCGCQGNQATIATVCVACRHCPKEPPYQI